jgi:hypothetical protein
MKAKDKKLRPAYSATRAEGYIIVQTRYSSEKWHVPASSIMGLQASYYGTELALAFKDDNSKIDLRMPLECAQYFVHLAKQGLEIDLSSYCGGFSGKRITKDSPEHHQLRLKMQRVTPEDILEMQARVSRKFGQAATTAPALEETDTSKARCGGLDRFPFLSEHERAEMEARAKQRQRSLKKT